MSFRPLVHSDNVQSMGPFTKRMTIRKRVSSACAICKKSRVRCDDQRPCKRCLHFGREMFCLKASIPANEGVPPRSNISPKSYIQDYQDVLVSGQGECRRIHAEHASSFLSHQLPPLEVPANLGNTTIYRILNDSGASEIIQDVSCQVNTATNHSFCPSSTFARPNPVEASVDYTTSAGIFSQQSSGPTQAALLEHLVAYQRQEILATISRMVQPHGAFPVPSPMPTQVPALLSALSPINAAAIAALLASGGVPPPAPRPAPPQPFGPSASTAQSYAAPPPSFLPRFF